MSFVVVLMKIVLLPLNLMICVVVNKPQKLEIGSVTRKQTLKISPASLATTLPQLVIALNRAFLFTHNYVAKGEVCSYPQMLFSISPPVLEFSSQENSRCDSTPIFNPRIEYKNNPFFSDGV
jgi:hypothetical protein